MTALHNLHLQLVLVSDAWTWKWRDLFSVGHTIHTSGVGRMNECTQPSFFFNFLSLKWQTATELGRPRLQFTYLFLMSIIIKKCVTGSGYQSQLVQGQLQKEGLGHNPRLVLEENKYARHFISNSSLENKAKQNKTNFFYGFQSSYNFNEIKWTLPG